MMTSSAKDKHAIIIQTMFFYADTFLISRGLTKWPLLYFTLQIEMAQKSMFEANILQGRCHYCKYIIGRMWQTLPVFTQKKTIISE